MSDLIFVYQNMTSKYGWNDGNEEPVGSYDLRDAIVRLINDNLPEDCPVEAYGYDRSGMHNGALILYRIKGSKEDTEEDAPPEIHKILAAADELDFFTVYVEISCQSHDLPIPQNESLKFNWRGKSIEDL